MNLDMTKHALDTPQFFLTAPAPCPYLPDQTERKVFTHLVGDRARGLNEILTQGGFRRSQNIAYRPACEGCNACISVRILVNEFEPTKTMRRIMKRNEDLVAKECESVPTTEQYSLFRNYLDQRHESGGMSDMTVLDYAMMVEDSHVDTMLIEYRLPAEGGGRLSRRGGPLMAVALTDVMSDGLSMVYSFFETDDQRRSLGTYIILDHIRRAKALGLPHIYLGYWVGGSPKMAYKTRFQPQEHLSGGGWQRHNPLGVSTTASSIDKDI